MPAKDDGVVYWLPTPALVFATDSKVTSNPYWPCFREAAEELYRAYKDTVDLPENIKTTWRTPRFRRMQVVYKKTWKENQTSAAGAFNVIRRYRAMKLLGKYDRKPIELFTVGDGRSKNADDRHAVEVDGRLWHYSKLDGNHRLMAAFFLGFERVPITLKSIRAGSEGSPAQAAV